MKAPGGFSHQNLRFDNQVKGRAVLVESDPTHPALFQALVGPGAVSQPVLVCDTQLHSCSAGEDVALGLPPPCCCARACLPKLCFLQCHFYKDARFHNNPTAPQNLRLIGFWTLYFRGLLSCLMPVPVRTLGHGSS